jgi:hypothetical protein
MRFRIVVDVKTTQQGYTLTYAVNVFVYKNIPFLYSLSFGEGQG